MARIGEGIGLSNRGEREAARLLLLTIWQEIGGRGDALHRCALAHHLADLQDDPREELAWDLRALEAADSISDERARQAGIAGPVRDFYPSLHLNLGDVYLRLGDRNLAREHLDRGRIACQALPDDGYTRMIRNGLARLAGQLSD